MEKARKNFGALGKKVVDLEGKIRESRKKVKRPREA